METNIQTAISSASPISAYGIQELPKSPRILRLIGGLFCLFLLIGSIAAYFIQLPIPEKPALLGLLHGGTKLPEQFPLAWRESLEPSIFPVFIGLSSKQEQFEPFAIVLRIQPTPGLNRQNLGPFALVRAKTGSLQSKRLYSTIPFLWKLPQAAINLSLYIYEDVTTTIHLSGPFESNQWKTDLSFSNSDAITPLPDLSNAINLDLFPKAQNLVQTQLTESLGLPPEPLQSLAWENQAENFTQLELHFKQQTVPASSTIALLGSFGLRDQTQLILEDGTLVEEYRLPSQTFLAAATSSTWQPSSSTIITSTGSTLKFSNLKSDKPSVSTCPGTPIFRLNQTSLEQALHLLAIPFSPTPSSVTGSIQEKKLILCVD